MKACACVAVCPRAALVAISVCPSCRRLAMSGSNEVQVLLLEVCLTGDTHLSNSLSTDGAKLQLGNIISLDALHVCNSQTSEYVPFRQRGLLQRPNCTADLKRSGNFKCHMSRIGVNLKFRYQVRDEGACAHWLHAIPFARRQNTRNITFTKIRYIKS